MNTRKMSRQLALLTAALVASGAALAQSGTTGSGMSSGGSGLPTDTQVGTPSGPSGNTTDRTIDPTLDTLPPTNAGDAAPSTTNPDKGPHAVKKSKSQMKKKRSGETEHRDPNQVNSSMDGEGSSGTTMRSGTHR